MATFTRVLAFGFMLIAGLGGCVLIYIAVSELFRRRPRDGQARVEKREEQQQWGWR